MSEPNKDIAFRRGVAVFGWTLLLAGLHHISPFAWFIAVDALAVIAFVLVTIK